MKQPFNLFQRAGIFYCEDTRTGKQTSLRTRDRADAVRLLHVKNEAVHQPAMNLQIAQVYLQHGDPALLADKILEATGVNPSELAAGRKAVDVKGNSFTKQSYEDYKKWILDSGHSVEYYQSHLVRYIELLLISSERAGQTKLHSVVAALQNAFAKIAEDFDLTKNINGLIIEKGLIRKRTYLVRDLRKFPEYARRIEFKDNKRFKPNKRIKFDIPNGCLADFDRLVEQPVFSKDIERKLADKDYIIDFNRPIPNTPEFKDLNEALPKALY